MEEKQYYNLIQPTFSLPVLHYLLMESDLWSALNFHNIQEKSDTVFSKAIQNQIQDVCIMTQASLWSLWTWSDKRSDTHLADWVDVDVDHVVDELL